MTWYRVGPAGIPGSLKTDMDAVLNKKFGTSTTYAPNTWPDNVNLLGPLPEKTASGSIATITDGADGVPLKNWLVTLPASLDGYTEVNGVKSGANLFNEDWEVGGINDTTGLPNSDTNKIRSKSFSIIKGGTTCYVSVPQPIRVLFYTSAESFISETANIRNNSFSVPSNCSLFKIRGTVDYGTTYNNDIMISYGNTATAYEAYTAPTQYTAQLGRTIYGGTADIVTGEGEDENGNAFTFTPITPTPETALGVNNFWADEGDSDVTYRADISLALQALGGGGRGLMGMMMQRPEEEQLTEENPEEQPEETEINER